MMYKYAILYIYQQYNIALWTTFELYASTMSFTSNFLICNFNMFEIYCMSFSHAQIFYLKNYATKGEIFDVVFKKTNG
jgi:hypothetical protein